MYRNFFTTLLMSLLLVGCQLEVSALDVNQQNSQDTTTSATSRDVTLYWSTPMQRVNGELLTSVEIGGFEIRYRKQGDAHYQSVIIRDAAVDQYSFLSLADADSYHFEVATFDLNGMYSDFRQAVIN